MHFHSWYEQAKQSFSGKAVEPVLALLLYADGGPESFCETKTTVPAFHYFREKFPESPYLPYFQDYMKKIAVAYAENPSDPSIHFIENRNSIKSLSELVFRLKGKKLYVDIWTTTCKPCRAEFQDADSLETILKQNGVTPLYISLNEDFRDQKWKAFVYTHKLKGFHFRANPAFMENLKQLRQEEENYSLFPGYVFIDENGNIVEKKFRKPSVFVSSRQLFGPSE